MCDIMLTLLLFKKVINAKQIFIKLPKIIGKIIFCVCVCFSETQDIFFINGDTIHLNYAF